MTLLKFNQSSGWAWWCKCPASGHSDTSPSPDSGSEMKVSDRGFHLSGAAAIWNAYHSYNPSFHF